MVRDDRLRERVAAAIAHGRLPTRLPKKYWAGQGSGNICAFCERPITPEQLDAECPDGQDQEQSYHLHLRCLTDCESVMRAGMALGEPSLLGAADGGYSSDSERALEKGSTS